MTTKKASSGSVKAISLFSGAGGMDLGLIHAGFEISACIEIDPNCCNTLRSAAEKDKRNTIVVEGDIRKVDPETLRQQLKIKPGELVLLCGGSPCQSFSQIGKRQCLEDDRGQLLFEFVRFAKVFKPRAILLEQVKGLLNAPDLNGVRGGVYQLLLTELEKLGYHAKMQIINASKYGVAQYRERVFIVATHDEGFHFPTPSHGEVVAGILPMFKIDPIVTVGDALKGLDKPVLKGKTSSDPNHVDVTPDGDRRRINGVSEGSHLARELHLPAEQRGRLTKKDTTKYLRLSRKDASNTLRCGEIFFHPSQNRYLTPREYMRIHGYPDDYILKGPIRSRSGRVRDLDQHRQVANSVPPPVAQVIGTAILKHLSSAKKPAQRKGSPYKEELRMNG